jgi:hypothetical protein
VVADGTTPENDSCGDGTHYDADSLSCVPDLPPTECGPNTTMEVGDDGVIICVGSGGFGNCSDAGQCPQPNPDSVAVCGQIFDIETNEPLAAEGATGVPCDPDNPTADGPCSLEVVFYDPLTFAGMPTTTAPQPADDIVIDDCGRYRGENIELPFNTYLAVTTDDATGDAEWILTGIAFQMEGDGQRLPDVRAFATRHSTDEMWTETAGDPFGGMTFSEKGVYVPTFRYGTPVANVKITGLNGQVYEADDYYFSDADPETKTTIDPDLDMTGANGAGLFVNSSLTFHSGAGAEPEGCQWPSSLAATIPNVVFAQDRNAEIAGMPDVLCPP